MIKKQLNENGRLGNDAIVTLVRQHMASEIVQKYVDNEKYLKGQNPTIMAKPTKDEGVPDNRVPVPYGRKVSLTTKNYMFNRPVVLQSTDTAFIDSINDNNALNQYDRKTAEVGLDLIVHGYAYKLFYVDRAERGGIIPRYVVVEQNEIIPIYSYDIEPRLIAAIRYYKREGDKYFIEVYYSAFSQRFSWTRDSMEIVPEGDEAPHDFPGVPLVIYGDSYQIGVFDAVKPIIDGIDSITSTDINEVDRFALAYLVLKGQKMTKDTVKGVKEKRLFELDEKATLEYLTKTIDTQFHGSVRDFLVAEVHKQTGVPDFASKEFAAESGVALLYKLMGFENLASDIQSVFEAGEIESVKMQSKIIFRTDKIPDDLWIEMSRNLPRNVIEKIDEAIKLKMAGISQKTIVELLAGVLSVSADEEIEREEEERAAYVDLNNVPIPGDGIDE